MKTGFTQYTIAIISISLLLILICPSFAAIKPDADLLTLCTSADLIIAGRVESVVVTDEKFRLPLGGNENEFGLWQASLVVDNIIRGAYSGNGIGVEFIGPVKGQTGVMGVYMRLEFLKPGETVVLFLRYSDRHAGSYTLANNFKSAIRIANSSEVIKILKGKQPEEKIETYIASLLTASLDSLSGVDLKNAVSDLAMLQEKRSSAAINAALDNIKDPVIWGETLITLFRLGDYSRLPEAVAFIQSEGKSDSVSLNVKSYLASKISLIKDTDLVGKYCIPLLQHRDEQIRRFAAKAVRNARMRTAMPQLIKGLQDSDDEVKYECLMGLADMLGRVGAWAPSYELFLNKKQEYVMRWQNWWDSGGKDEYMTIRISTRGSYEGILVRAQ